MSSNSKYNCDCTKKNPDKNHKCGTCINEYKGVLDYPCWFCVHDVVGIKRQCWYKPEKEKK